MVKVTRRRFLIGLLGVILIIAVGAALWRLILQPALPPVESFVVSGIVTDRETEKPLAGAEVSVGDFKASTGANGFYKILGVRFGPYNLRVSMEGYKAYEESITVNRNLTINVVLAPLPPPSPTLISTITLTADPSTIPENGITTITAVVKKQDGTPVAGITVRFSSDGQPGSFDKDPPEVVTDASGVASIKWTNEGWNGLMRLSGATITSSATIDGQLIQAKVDVMVLIMCAQCEHIW